MPKLDGTFRCIYNLFLPKPRLGLSVNAAILIIAFFVLVYYLNDFIFILYLGTSYTPVIYVYNFIIILLSFPLNTTKDFYSTVLDVLGY